MCLPNMPLRSLLNRMATAKSKTKTSSSSNTTAIFPKFSNLPLEIRQEIWRETLPGPRVMLVTLSKSKNKKKNGTATTKPASYGGRHPALLSVDRTSRAEGFRFLRPKFNAFWNFELDTPYFEIKDNSDENVVLLAQLSRQGLLNDFKNIAVDWMVWNWRMATQNMEFRVTFGNKFNDYEHPYVYLGVRSLLTDSLTTRSLQQGSNTQCPTQDQEMQLRLHRSHFAGRSCHR